MAGLDINPESDSISN